MKKQFTGFSKIFSFTFTQHVKSKGYKNTTLTIAILCLLLPALVMFGIEYLGDKDKGVTEQGGAAAEENIAEEEAFAAMDELDRIMVVDLSEDKELDTSMLAIAIKEIAGTDTQIIDMGEDFDTARRAAIASSDALIMVIEQDGSSYNTSIVIPDDSSISGEAADELGIILDQYTQILSGQYEQPEAEQEDPMEGIEDIVAMAVGYLNIMILYFFVLAYGQGVANSVVMEKSSKLIESFLVSVKPAAMVLGKLLAITATGIIQLFSWILSLVISFAAGTAIVKSMNPDTDMLIIKGFEMLKTLLDGMLSPANCIMAILMVIAGLLLYCALAGIGGALASKTEDLSSANVLFTLILVVSFFGALAGGGLDPTAEASPLLDWIPFTSVMVTPGRILMGMLPLWKTVACFAVTLITSLLATALAGKVYKAMVLYKGDVPKPKDIITMLRRS